jgi:hypothetical protein
MKHRLKSLTAKGRSGYKPSSRNLPNSLALADEFSRSNRGKKCTVPGCISLRRLRSPFRVEPNRNIGKNLFCGAFSLN